MYVVVVNHWQNGDAQIVAQTLYATEDEARADLAIVAAEIANDSDYSAELLRGLKPLAYVHSYGCGRYHIEEVAS